MTFSEWIHELNAICMSTWGIGISDLPDMCIRDAYEDGVSALQFFHDEIGTVDALSRLILA